MECVCPVSERSVSCVGFLSPHLGWFAAWTNAHQPSCGVHFCPKPSLLLHHYPLLWPFCQCFRDTSALIAGSCWFPCTPVFGTSAQCHRSYKLSGGTYAFQCLRKLKTEHVSSRQTNLSTVHTPLFMFTFIVVPYRVAHAEPFAFWVPCFHVSQAFCIYKMYLSQES